MNEALWQVRWLSAQEEARLTAWMTPAEKEAKAIAKAAIRRDPEPRYRMADLTEQEERRLRALSITYGFIPNGHRTDLYWYKHGAVIRYMECLI